MNTRDFINSKLRPKIVSTFTAIFGLIYHFTFLFVFYAIGVYQMAVFNIFSVATFILLTFMAIKTDKIFLLYLIGMLEVVAHQVLADYFLGGHASFHFFLLIIGFLPFLLFTEKIKVAIRLSFFPIFLFGLIEVFNVMLPPVYLLDMKEMTIIKSVNIGLSLLVIAIMICIFSYIVSRVENHLEEEVKNQTEKLQSQNERIINIQKNTIFSLSSLVENRDSDTGDHIKRTSSYAQLLANAAKEKGYYTDVLTEKYIDLIYRAAPMHDIGKIVVSDVILKKPGKLTSEEFMEIQRHAKEGGRIIKEVLGDFEDVDYVTVASEIATGHHEKWNGTGYPNNLKETQIPLSARIMAIADVFDALVSKRCYKDAMDDETAFEIIKNDAGSHFDPTLAEIFLEKKNEVLKIHNTYKE